MESQEWEPWRLTAKARRRSSQVPQGEGEEASWGLVIGFVNQEEEQE